MRKAGSGIIGATAVGALCLAVSGCGSGSSASSALDPVAKAADATSSAKSFRLTLNGNVSAGGISFSLQGNGAFDQAHKLGNLNFTIPNLPGGSGSLTFKELFDNNVIYIGFPSGLPGGASLPGGKQWIKIDLQKALASKGINLGQLSGLAGNDPSQYLSYLRSTGHVKKIGTETVQGVSTTHYHAIINLQQVAKQVGRLSPAAKAGFQSLLKQTGSQNLPVDVWIDSSNMVRQERISYGSSTTSTPVNLTLTLDLSDFGTPVSVTPPPASQVYDATAAATQGLSGQSGQTSTTPIP